MKRDWIEDGWRRFLDRLKDLWGKRTGPGPTTAISLIFAPNALEGFRIWAD